MSTLEDAARALLNDHDSNVSKLESIGKRVTRWPEMEALRAALAEAEKVEPEVLVRNEREDHFRIWESAGAWLYPGDCIAVLRAAGGEG